MNVFISSNPFSTTVIPNSGLQGCWSLFQLSKRDDRVHPRQFAISSQGYASICISQIQQNLGKGNRIHTNQYWVKEDSILSEVGTGCGLWASLLLPLVLEKKLVIIISQFKIRVFWECANFSQYKFSCEERLDILDIILLMLKIVVHFSI